MFCGKMKVAKIYGSYKWHERIFLQKNTTRGGTSKNKWQPLIFGSISEDAMIDKSRALSFLLYFDQLS